MCTCELSRLSQVHGLHQDYNCLYLLIVLGATTAVVLAVVAEVCGLTEKIT